MKGLDNKKIPLDIRKLAVGIIYILLIGVVLYGRTDHVYDGFGGAAAWIIMLLFAIMAAARIAEAVTGESALGLIYKLLDKLLDRADTSNDDSSDDAEKDAAQDSGESDR